MTSESDRGPVLEWWWLACTTCGHWVKGAATKEQVADWLRVHSAPTMSPSTEGVTCESTCPHPCQESDSSRPWSDCDPRCIGRDDCVVATTCKAKRESDSGPALHAIVRDAVEFVNGLDDRQRLAAINAGILDRRFAKPPAESDSGLGLRHSSRAAEDYPYPTIRNKIYANIQWARMCNEIDSLRADVSKLLTMLADAGAEWPTDE